MKAVIAVSMLALLGLFACTGPGQTPEEMAAAAKACRAGGFKVEIMEYIGSGRRFVQCGAYIGPDQAPTEGR